MYEIKDNIASVLEITKSINLTIKENNERMRQNDFDALEFSTWFWHLDEKLPLYKAVNMTEDEKNNILGELIRKKHPKIMRRTVELWLKYSNWKYRNPKKYYVTDFYPTYKMMQEIEPETGPMITIQMHEKIVNQRMAEYRLKQSGELDDKKLRWEKEAPEYMRKLLEDYDEDLKNAVFEKIKISEEMDELKKIQFQHEKKINRQENRIEELVVANQKIETELHLEINRKKQLEEELTKVSQELLSLKMDVELEIA